MILPHFTTSHGLRYIAPSAQAVVYRAIHEMHLGHGLHDVWSVEPDDSALIDAVKNQTEDGKRLLQLILKYRLQS